MGEVDQRNRDVDAIQRLPPDEQQAFMRAAAEADAAHARRLKEIVEEWGWPTRATAGEEASNAAFLLIQHADGDPEFQAATLPLLEEAAARDEIPLRDVAYLTDRVRAKQGRPQVYGTQYGVRTDSAGNVVADSAGNITYVLPVVEDVENLDARRSAAGLGPWAEYERRMAASQGREPATRPESAQGPESDSD